MPNKNNRHDRRPTDRDDARREGTDLDRRYGRIGISAVAAAARYCGPSEASTRLPPVAHEKRDETLGLETVAAARMERVMRTATFR